MSYRFVKGHGTENDFVLLPDPDGTVHGDLGADRVRALCDRRAGIGADGVLRVVRSARVADAPPEVVAGAEWFMDYRNADGSVAEMCGNGLRVFARLLLEDGYADGSAPLVVGTRAGLRTVTVEGDLLSADLGRTRVLEETKVAVAGRSFAARQVDVGNPHAVVFVDDLAEAGALLEAPDHDPAVFPDGVNVEFVVRQSAPDRSAPDGVAGAGRLSLRVHERGVGETRSCGTGACAAAAAAAHADGVGTETPAKEPPVTYRVRVPGGTLWVSWSPAGRVLLTGPAVLVATGATDL